MRSPFPGMDPYLEAHWRDVHPRLVTYACDALQPRLPPDLRARMEERVFIEASDSDGRGVYPDVRVVEKVRAATTGLPVGGPAAAGVAVAEPLVIHIADEPASQGYIEVVDVGSGGRVVTVIEVVSLANKRPGEGQDLYLQKQRDRRQARVSLVEIDLLRAGRRILAVPPARVPPSHRTPYAVCVSRAQRPGTFELYRAPLREPLPAIAVPLRDGDPDAPLDLQALIDRSYENGRYDDIDYGREPDPPLDPEDAAWTAELLKAKGLR